MLSISKMLEKKVQLEGIGDKCGYHYQQSQSEVPGGSRVKIQSSFKRFSTCNRKLDEDQAYTASRYIGDSESEEDI